MVGVQSSLIMFPVNILIVSIFRHTRPREATCCRRKTKKTNILEQESTLQTVSSQTTNMNVNATLDIIIKVGASYLPSRRIFKNLHLKRCCYMNSLKRSMLLLHIENIATFFLQSTVKLTL